jgi:hypothetical protein
MAELVLSDRQQKAVASTISFSTTRSSTLWRIVRYSTICGLNSDLAGGPRSANAQSRCAPARCAGAMHQIDQIAAR